MFTELNEPMIKEVKQGMPHKIYHKNRDRNYKKEANGNYEIAKYSN